MKKIGILTFHRAKSYGAVLQAYALKQVLCKLNCSVSIIDYTCYVMRFGWRFNFLPGKIKLFIRFLKNFKSINSIKTYFNFNNFVNNFFVNKNTKQKNIEQLYKLNENFDLFITGSDQVFNPRLTGFDKNYFLDFVKDKNKCFSYAASFGLTYDILTDEEKIFIKQNLQNFKYLSLREKQGAYIVNKLSNVKTEVNLDPTLLLNKQDWSKISEKPKEDNFVVLYLLESDEKIVKFAYDLAKTKKMKLICFNLYNEKINMKMEIVNPTPQEWLGYMLNAKYIVTNSFHGITFSINFNKAFFVDFLTKNTVVSSRVENLLDLTGLRNRLIDNIGTDYDKAIDWTDINKIIEQGRDKSITYLKKVLANFIYGDKNVD